MGAAPAADRQWRPRSAADRYSRRVALLKRVLPAIGVALLLLVAAWPRLAPLLDSVRLGFAAIDLREARELKMLNPRYAGIDRLNRPYVVTAAVGRQVPNRSDLMSLERPRAVMTVHGGAKVVLTAATGIYQSQTQLLDLFGDVTLTHQNGTRFVTSRAHADFSDNTAEGHDPIEGHGPSGDIWGQGFRILDKGDTIIFTGRSHAAAEGDQAGQGGDAAPGTAGRRSREPRRRSKPPRACSRTGGARQSHRRKPAQAGACQAGARHRPPHGPHPANGRADNRRQAGVTRQRPAKRRRRRARSNAMPADRASDAAPGRTASGAAAADGAAARGAARGCGFGLARCGGAGPEPRWGFATTIGRSTSPPIRASSGSSRRRSTSPAATRWRRAAPPRCMPTR